MKCCNLWDYTVLYVTVILVIFAVVSYYHIMNYKFEKENLIEVYNSYEGAYIVDIFKVSDIVCDRMINGKIIKGRQFLDQNNKKYYVCIEENTRTYVEYSEDDVFKKNGKVTYADIYVFYNEDLTINKKIYME